MRRRQTFAAEEVEWILTVAKGQDKTSIPEKFWWIARLTKDQARDELVYRFQRLIVALVEVCLTGRPKVKTKCHAKLLKLFGANQANQSQVAMMLKKNLAAYPDKQLYEEGRGAAYQAIDRCKKNYYATLIICFHEVIESLIQNSPVIYLPELPETIEAPDWQGDLLFSISMQNIENVFPADEVLIIKRILDGEKVGRISKGLKEKLAIFLGYQDSIGSI